jgi:hypothetical protein
LKFRRLWKFVLCLTKLNKFLNFRFSKRSLRLLQRWSKMKSKTMCWNFVMNFIEILDFSSKRKKKKYDFINVVLKMNRVIIRNANLLFAMNEFLEEFFDCVIVFLMNLFFEYDQLSLIEKCRNIIVFMTSLNLMKMITIFMKAINFMIQFVWIINKIIVDHVFHHALSFVNDIEVKSLKTTYNNEFILSEIRRYVMKHIQWLNDVLIDIERANCITFEEKFQFCCEELRIIKFVCDVEKRHLNTTKIIKILNWLSCKDIFDAREFIEICVFYRVFIAEFAFIAQLIYALLKKNVSFV